MSALNGKKSANMEQETLYTSAKWDVLRAMASASKSPIELADASNTSISNISQSLRFLELAGIVKSERISNRDKGLPRVTYSLAGDKAYLIITSRNFVEKKQIILSDHKKMILKAWLYENESLSDALEKAVGQIEEYMEKLDGVFVDKASGPDINILLVPKEKSFKPEIKPLSLIGGGIQRKVKFSVADKQTISKSSGQYYALHDHLQIIGGDDKG